MEYKKFELIRSGDNPLIRITHFETVIGFFTNHKVLKVRDVVKDRILISTTNWVFVDTGTMVHRSDPITAFYESQEKEYIINGK